MKVLLVNLYKSFANLLLNTLRALLYKKPKTVQKILVFRTGSMGDSLCAFPAIYSLKEHYPDAQLDILTAAGSSNLVSIEKMLDPSMYNRIIDYQNLSMSEWSSLVRQNKYDLVVQLPQNKAPLKSLIRDLIFFRIVTKIKSGFGWQLEYVPFFRQAQEKAIEFTNERDRLLQILKTQGISPSQTEVRVHSTQEDIDAVEALIPEKLKHSQSISLVVGAKRPQNRWSIGHFEELVKQLHWSYNIFLIGGPGDEILASNILNISNVHNFAGKCTPVQSALLMQKCQLTISNDTGPMHLSYFSGTPVVALFSSRDFPGIWYPPNTGQNKVFRNMDVHCSLCLSENCDNNICMQGISTLEVLEAVQHILQNKSRSDA